MYKSTFMGLNTALRGVLAQQASLDVTSHNISNLETDGYTRQRADLVTAPAWSNASAMSQTAPGQMGTGVEVKYLERLRDQYVDANVRQQLGAQGQQQALVDQLQQVESAFSEPGDNGISALVKKYYDAAATVAAKPDEPSARQAFANAADQLTQAFRTLNASLSDVQNQSDTRLNDTVSDINTIASQIASLNTQIARAIDRNQQPNDLLDTRDQLMDNLSKLTNFTYTTAPTGEVTITLGATFGNIVDPTAANGYNAIARSDLDTMYANGEMTGGRALADEQLWDPAGAGGSAGTGIVDTIRGQLDAWVSNFVSGMNAQSASGVDLNGNPGGDMFLATGTTAATFALDTTNNILANPSLIAASGPWASPGVPEPGNGQNFSALVNTLRTTGQVALGNQTFEAYYSGVVTGLGAQSQTAQRNASNADVLVSMATSRRTQVSGVSLDEEMTNMLRFQHAYDASARVLTTMDDALDTIINRMGRVGL